MLNDPAGRTGKNMLFTHLNNLKQLSENQQSDGKAMYKLSLTPHSDAVKP